MRKTVIVCDVCETGSPETAYNPILCGSVHVCDNCTARNEPIKRFLDAIRAQEAKDRERERTMGIGQFNPQAYQK